MVTRALIIPKPAPEALVRNPNLRLTDPEAIQTLNALRQRIIDDPSYGQGLLRQAGIVNAKGKLTKAFGG